MSQQPGAPDPVPFDVAIIGGGASGVLVAAHLLRASNGLRLALIERNERLGSGVAYATTRPEHLLNVTAGGMSAFEDDADHFVHYLAATGEEALAPARLRQQYAQRRRYGEYLRFTLKQAQAASRSRFDVMRDAVVGLGGTDPLVMTMRSGPSVLARSVVLALGNWPRELASIVDPALAGAILRGWDYAGVARLDRASEILIVGSGLSMVDAVLTLAANDHRGPIHVVSRHGLMPLAHAGHGKVDLDVEAFARLPLRQRMRLLRQAAGRALGAGEPWQWVMDTLRSHNVTLWETLTLADQRRFLRHAVRRWDVHRHRIPATAAGVLQSLLAAGRLHHQAGHIQAMARTAGRWCVTIRPRNGDANRSIVADQVIDCLGMQPDIRRVPDPAVQSLLAQGVIRRGAHGIGLDTERDGAVIDAHGQPNPRIHAIGSVRVGSLWESVAIPELRKQAAAIAASLTMPRR